MSDDEPPEARTLDVLLETLDFGQAGGRTRSSFDAASEDFDLGRRGRTFNGVRDERSGYPT
jgi:hypothetical protein